MDPKYFKLLIIDLVSSFLSMHGTPAIVYNVTFQLLKDWFGQEFADQFSLITECDNNNMYMFGRIKEGESFINILRETIQ